MWLLTSPFLVARLCSVSLVYRHCYSSCNDYLANANYLPVIHQDFLNVPGHPLIFLGGGGIVRVRCVPHLSIQIWRLTFDNRICHSQFYINRKRMFPILPGNGERNWYFITIQEKDWKYQQQTWEWAGGNEKANGVTRSGQWSLFVLLYPPQIQQHS